MSKKIVCPGCKKNVRITCLVNQRVSLDPDAIGFERIADESEIQWDAMADCEECGFADIAAVFLQESERG